MKKISFGCLLIFTMVLLSGCGGNLDSDLAVSGVISPSNGCDKACENYIDKCLTLVPGATENLFKQGRESCFEECVGWDVEKIECIATSQNCTYMTDECEL